MKWRRIWRLGRADSDRRVVHGRRVREVKEKTVLGLETASRVHARREAIVKAGDMDVSNREPKKDQWHNNVTDLVTVKIQPLFLLCIIGDPSRCFAAIESRERPITRIVGDATPNFHPAMWAGSWTRHSFLLQPQYQDGLKRIL